MKKKTIAIIPARKGSKRLKNKNILKFLGLPLIVHTIKSAVKSKVFDEIVVSTDSKKIKNISKKFPVIIHDRPKNLATDKSTINQVCKFIINDYKKKKINLEYICVLYPTAPLRNSLDIRNTMKLLNKNNKFAIGVTSFDHYPHHALILKEKTLVPVWKKLINKKVFKNNKFFVDNGSIYAAEVKSFIKYNSFIGPKLKGYFMPRLRSIDIDTLDDFKFLKKTNYTQK